MINCHDNLLISGKCLVINKRERERETGKIFFLNVPESYRNFIIKYISIVLDYYEYSCGK